MKIPQIIEDNKHLFGTYSTMALANIRNILDHIATLACIENDFNADSDDFWHHHAWKSSIHKISATM